MTIFDQVSFKTSEEITKAYSTSFYSATSLFQADIRRAIFSIYAFVRFADEIVDTFHEFDKRNLLENFEKDYYQAYAQGVSLNPVLQAFQLTVKQYQIPDAYIQSFLFSMKKDLHKKGCYNKQEIDEYIYGSADVVGLMCLRVFCDGNKQLCDELEYPAMKLGSAFQKVNFLRDLKNDIENLDRCYFMDVNKSTFNEQVKTQLVTEIEFDFSEAKKGLKKLPFSSKTPVWIAYAYYQALLKKLKNTPAQKIISTRIRISNTHKCYLFCKIFILGKLNLI